MLYPFLANASGYTSQRIAKRGFALLRLGIATVTQTFRQRLEVVCEGAIAVAAAQHALGSAQCRIELLVLRIRQRTTAVELIDIGARNNRFSGPRSRQTAAVD